MSWSQLSFQEGGSPLTRAGHGFVASLGYLFVSGGYSTASPYTQGQQASLATGGTITLQQSIKCKQQV